MEEIFMMLVNPLGEGAGCSIPATNTWPRVDDGGESEEFRSASATVGSMSIAEILVV
jgi:hypothetical protein